MTDRPIWDACTESQRNVLVVLATHGWENHRIARELGITKVAVKGHIRTMCAKLKLKGRTALVVAYLAECQSQSLPDSPANAHKCPPGQRVRKNGW
jgi:DNA-binding NarL/FixJ family response regulator